MKITMWVGGAIVVIASIIFIACPFQPSDPSDPSTPGMYACSNGTGASGAPAGSENIERCAQCDDGYHINNETCEETQFSVPSGYELVWSDEFNGVSIDSTKWNYDTDPTGNAVGWGNSELQNYTDGSGGTAYIENGHLVIEAKYTAGEYTSARLHTHGTQSFHYGIIAAHIRQPSDGNGNSDSGVWPAFWTLGDNFNGWGHGVYGGDTAWPASGEIDIMELFGKDGTPTTETTSAMHWHVANSQQNCRHNLNPNLTNHCFTSGSLEHSTNIYQGSHIYGIEWTDEEIRFFVDERTVFTQDITDSQFDPFQLPHFLLLNIAVGGNPVSNPRQANYPLKMYVDWVRHYQCEGDICGETTEIPSVSGDDYVIYSDNADEDLPQDTFQHYGGYENTATATKMTNGGAQDSESYLRISGIEARPWAAGGWSRAEGNATATVDLSDYGTLLFSVRSSSADNNRIIAKLEDSTQANGVGKEIGRSFTANSRWQGVCIPLSEFTSGANAVMLDSLRAPFVYVLSANDAVIDIDEVYFATSDTCA